MKKIPAMTIALLILTASVSLPTSSSVDATGTIGMETPPRTTAQEVTNSSASTERTPGLHIIASDEYGVTLELFTPEYDLEDGQSTQGNCQMVNVPHYGEGGEPGAPRIPVLGAMIGIPPQEEITLSVEAADFNVAHNSIDLCPVPDLIPDINVSQEMGNLEIDVTPNLQLYNRDDFTPASPAQIISTGFLRSQRVAQLRLHPFQYNPASRTLRHYYYIRVRVDFPQADGRTTLPNLNEGPFEDTLRTLIVNYDTARNWRSYPERLEVAESSVNTISPAYKIMVDEAGIYQLTYSYLEAAGLPVDELDPRTLQMSIQGDETAIHVAGES